MSLTRITTQAPWLWVCLSLALIAGALLRLPRLDRRPLHNDEANQAYKTGLLLDTGHYHYDPVDHHGPSLYYLTLPIAWARGQTRFANTTIGTYRGLTVLFGLLLIPLLILGRDALGNTATATAALFTAVSPAMVYFSRFYIQEILLVFFTFALLVCLWRYVRHPHAGWALGIGLSAGMMHATKETCVLAWMALGVAVLVGWRLRRKDRSALPERCFRWPHIALALGVAAAVSITLYSSFFTHGRGPLDSVLTYGTYLSRAGGPEQSMHHHPFWYYPRLLTYRRPVKRLTWGEDMVVLLALVGGLAAWIRPRRLGGSAIAVRTLSVYTLALTVAYSAIPYKTPWCMLSFWHAWILLAGVGLQVLLTLSTRRWWRVLLILIAWLGSLQLAHRAVLSSFRYAAHQRNPYVYAQTGATFMRLIDHIEKVRAAHPDDVHMRIHVIAAPDRTWPLPWYLRAYPNSGYWHEWTPAIVADSPTLIIADLEAAERLSNTILEDYIPNYYGLRPGVLLCGFFRRDAWERFIDAQAAGVSPEHPAESTDP